MSAVPFIPDTAPFTADQRAWLNGFFAGMFSRAPAPSSPPPIASLTPVTILFGSQTGTAESLAKRAAKEAGRRGFAATVLDLAQMDLGKLAAERNVLLITSTYGDGEPPDNARALHTAVLGAAHKASAVLLPDLRYSVCGIGDTNYTRFCQCARDFDEAWEKLGGSRIHVRVECDVDYEAAFVSWLDATLAALQATPGAVRASAHVPAAPPSPATPSPASPPTGFSRQNPYAARLVTSRCLNGTGSAKKVHHVEFALDDSGLSYAAGDALGVYPQNCPRLVADILTALGCDGEEAVPGPTGATLSLRRALTEDYDLGKPTAELLQLLAPAAAGRPETAYPTGPYQVIDALAARADVRLAPEDLVRTLRKLQPRLYSISSSPLARPGEVHLTVGAVQYELHGRQRQGVCSTFLTDRALAIGGRVGIFVHASPGFRPPAGDAPMIMIGPGTGIAPFRAFLQHRQATGAQGRNWLFFGDQSAATDFLYQDELTAWRNDGVLTRLDTAFSRDQAAKVYVQHRMLEQATELFSWLEAGAHFYVCGDASRMAKDVDAALHRVIEQAGGKTPEAAADYVAALKSARRYARDVY